MLHNSSSSSPPYTDPLPSFSVTNSTLNGPYSFLDSTTTAAATAAMTNMYSLSSSPPFSSASSLPSNNYFMHRSSSFSHQNHHHTSVPCSVADPASNSPFDLHRSHQPVRRVYSTGDLQQQQVAAAENLTQEGGGIGGRAVRYSAEEKMKRIERYRSKRNQRNFHKKITYACRKTLADSRPRVRGRFARNGEIEAEGEVDAETSVSENSYEFYSNINNYNNNTHTNSDNYMTNNSYSYENNGGAANGNGSGSGNGNEWWTQMHAALTTTDEDEECCYDEDLWASFESVFSMNLLS